MGGITALEYLNHGKPINIYSFLKKKIIMAQGKRISVEIGPETLEAIKKLGDAARTARTNAGENQGAAASRLGVHVQTIARIESGEPGVSVGHVMGMLALYRISVAPSKITGD